MATKVCTKCKMEKSLNQFGRHRGHKDGLNTQCKKCVNQGSKQYYKRNRDYYKQKRQEFKEENPRYCLKYREENAEKERERLQTYYQNNKERVKTQVKEYRKNNPEYWEKQSLYKKKNALQYKLYSCKATDKRGNREFNIDKAYIIQLAKHQNGRNLFTGTPIQWIIETGKAKRTGAHRSSSIDRINSSKGHVKENVQIVELWVNRLKLDYPTRMFQRTIKKILNADSDTHTHHTDYKRKKVKRFLWNTRHNTLKRHQRMSGGSKLDFTVEDMLKLWEKQKERCAISGMHVNLYPNNPFGLSIDRIDPEKPYYLENIHIVAWCINSARSNMSLDEFRLALDTLKAYQSKEICLSDIPNLFS